MVVDELVRFEDLTEETLIWTRPNFFSFRYELAGSTGVVVRLTVHGIGTERHVLAETADGTLRFNVFPLDRREVPISHEGQDGAIAIYHRKTPAHVDFVEGPCFQFRPETPLKMAVDGEGGQTVFTVEQVEAFPRWRAELKLEAEALALPQLPVLLGAVGCELVFV